MDGDRPITRREDDRLGFAPIADHLARAILELRASEGFVFGIEGKWGSGKSTLINLTIEALRTTGIVAPEVVLFSPWLVGDRDELLRSLFDELATAAVWPAPGSEDTELGVLMELEVGHGETEVHAGVQA
jgi:predicted KAP-like P-loop ATPase